ncbi:single-stranded DNA-binding protein [Pseudomonas pseudonitroreducens]|uniref:single-stranded DNA-binding protein n=1 Tax=Pseudomonas pseudonitroreducens TaxID=2892326 RepID=UPI001F3721E7|nr:single-stranded DNA-binding protein [Pseudomonas pseudonitroreducens]
MRNVTLPLEGELKEWAKSKSDDQVISEVLDVVLEHVRQRNTHDVEAIFRRNLESFPNGLEFEVAQVVGHEDWSALGRAERIRFGKQVRNNADQFGVVYVRTTVSRHNVYKKV